MDEGSLDIVFDVWMLVLDGCPTWVFLVGYDLSESACLFLFSLFLPFLNFSYLFISIWSGPMPVVLVCMVFLAFYNRGLSSCYAHGKYWQYSEEYRTTGGQQQPLYFNSIIQIIDRP